MKLIQHFTLCVAVALGSVILTGCEETQATSENQTAVSMQQSSAPQTALVNAEVPTASSSTTSQPKIVFSKNEVDFGTMAPNNYYTNEFEFTNRGNARLVIDNIKSTCGCTVPELEKLSYEPGESGTIKVTYHAQTSAGTVNKSISVSSNDPSNGSYALKIKGHVEVSLQLEPKLLKLSLREQNAGATPITIESTDGKPFSISQIQDYNSAISFDYDTKKKATKFVLTPKVDIEKLKVNPTGTVVVTAVNPEKNQLSFTYNAPKLYEISRPRIILQNADPATTETMDVWITSNYNEDFEIVSIKSLNGIMEVVSKEKIGSRYKLEIQIKPPSPTETGQRHFSDSLDISMDNSEKLSIACTGWFSTEVLNG